MNIQVIALDVGGTSIKAGMLDYKLNLLQEAMTTYPSMAGGDAETIIDNIIAVVYDQWELNGEIDNRCLGGLGIGFPGPFDYENGISYMQGIGKFDSIYGIDIASRIEETLYRDKIIPLAEDFAIRFENDAVLFGMGEYYMGKRTEGKRIMCLTLGTGCGSVFLEDGNVIRGEQGIPASGWIYKEPFKEGIIDDYISKRGIVKLATCLGMDPTLEVKDYSHMAKKGEDKAIELFKQFGELLGEAIYPYIASFKPEQLVLGGKISRAHTLFEETMYEQIPGNIQIFISKDLSKSALIGGASMLLRK